MIFGQKFVDFDGKEKIFYSFLEFYQISIIAIKKMVDDDFQPTLIIGIVRGGYFLADLFSRVFHGAPLILYPSRRYSDEEARKLEIKNTMIISEKSILIPADDNHQCNFDKGMKIVIVDELADTGETLKFIKQLICQRFPFLEDSSVKTLVAWHKETSKFQPNYFGEFIPCDTSSQQCPWIKTPWEAVGLVAKNQINDQFVQKPLFNPCTGKIES